MSFKRSALVAGLIACVAGPVAWAAGNFSTLPLVGGASFCAAIVGSGPAQGGATGQGAGAVGTAGTICAQTVPAGPTSLTGAEIVPADTLSGGGGPTQTVAVPVLILGSGAHTISTSASAALTVPNATNYFLLDTGTAATVTVTLSAAPIDGQRVTVACDVAVGTSLTIAANSGQTLKGGPAPGACAAGASFAFLYNSGNTTWYRGG